MDQIASSVAKLPIERLRRELFFDSVAARKICTEYGLPGGIIGDELEKTLFASLDMTEREGFEPASNKDVFKAAVNAIGSNSRPWYKFRGALRTIESKLHEFDPVKVASRAAEEQIERALTEELKGLTSGKDAKAIVQFAYVLNHQPDYWAAVNAAKRDIGSLVARSSSTIPAATTTLCVALILGGTRYHSPHCSLRKINGMGVALASEFLRNLGWEGFKPDRHINDRLRAWYSDGALDQIAAGERKVVEGIVGRLASTDRNPVSCALVGSLMTPPEVSVNRSDHLVWLYRSILGRNAK